MACQGLAGLIAAVGDACKRRGLHRALWPHQGGFPAGLGAQGGDRQGGGIGPQHDQARRRLEALAERPPPGRGRLVDRAAGAADAIAQPQGRRARLSERQQAHGDRRSRFCRRDPLKEDLHPRSAHQADVGPGAALAIDQPHAGALRWPAPRAHGRPRRLPGQRRRKETRGLLAGRGTIWVLLHWHRSWTAAIHGDDGGPARPARSASMAALEGRARIVGQAEQRPVRERVEQNRAEPWRCHRLGTAPRALGRTHDHAERSPDTAMTMSRSM